MKRWSSSSLSSSALLFVLVFSLGAGACGSDGSGAGDGAAPSADGPPAAAGDVGTTAADSGAPPTSGMDAAPATGDTGTPPVTTGDRFVIDGAASKNSGKATITDFRRIVMTAAFGIAPGVIPQDYVMAVELEYKDYLAVDGLNGAWMTDFVKQAKATLNMPATKPIGMGVWTPEAPGGIAFTLNVNAKKVSLTWKGPVSMGGQTYNVEAVMTDVPVPF